MRLTPAQLSLLLFCVIVIGMVIQYGFLGHQEVDASPLQQLRVSSFGLMTQTKAWLFAIPHLHTLSQENQNLKNENQRLLHQIAQKESLEKENGFLRQALKIERDNKAVIPAGIFNFRLTPNAYRVDINAGSQEGVMPDDVVTTSEGVLIGKVAAVHPRYSEVMFLADPDFSISVRVLGQNTTGIARGNVREGMTIDLILQNERIAEGDILVSNGNDLFPAGLIIGSVRHVSSNETDVFKSVKVDLAVKEAELDSVIVIRR